jgi:hypothetical protein
LQASGAEVRVDASMTVAPQGVSVVEVAVTPTKPGSGEASITIRESGQQIPVRWIARGTAPPPEPSPIGEKPRRQDGDSGGPPPSSATSLAVAAEVLTSTSVRLKWKSPGLTAADRYEVKYWNCATGRSSAGLPVDPGRYLPAEAGRTHGVVVSELVSGETYCFAIRVLDRSGTVLLEDEVRQRVVR